MRKLHSTLNRLMRRAPLARFSTVSPPAMPTSIRSAEQLSFTEAMYLDRELCYVNNQAKACEYVEKYAPLLTDEHVAQLTQVLVDAQVTLDARFNAVVAPVLAHYISLMNRENARCFGVTLRNLALLEVQSPALWYALVSVFRRERMHRYVPVETLSEVFVFLEAWEQPPVTLLREIAPMLHKQRDRIPQAYRDVAEAAYERVQAYSGEDASFLSESALASYAPQIEQKEQPKQIDK
mgnify:CR=1 FL=1